MLESLIGKPKSITLTSLFIAKRYVIEEICKYENPYPYIWGLVVRTTGKIANVPVEHRARTGSQSGYTLNKLLKLWLNGFTAFSVKPLRIAVGLGAVISLIGFVAAIYTVIDKVIHPDILPGYSALMSVLLIVGGIQMLLVGMLGEYLGRTYISINKSPQYVVKEARNVKRVENS
jgi:undecaprenyl-phosphate 4-deoxy-4-formamido-L-arabinose transferase